MITANTGNDAADVLNRSSVQFIDLRYNSQRAWPFWYNFIPYPYLDTNTQNNNLGIRGITCPAGEKTDIVINLQRDSVFRLINIKYNVNRCGFGSQIAGFIGITSGTNEIGGLGTLFETEFVVGNSIIWLDDNKVIQSGVISQIDSDTVMFLEENILTESSITPGFHKILLSCDTVPCQSTDPLTTTTGTVTIPPGGDVVAGVLTTFLTDYLAGDVFQVRDVSGINRLFMVESIPTNFTMIITETLAGGDPGVAAGSTITRLTQNVGLPGTISIDNTTHTITGVGTSFDDATFGLKAGDTLFYEDVNNVVAQLQIDKVITEEIAYYTKTAINSDPTSFYSVAESTSAPSPVPRNLLVYRPLTDFVRVTLFYPSLRDRYSYGASQVENDTGLIERPLPITDLQGVDDGLGGRLRTESLQPYEGLVVIRVLNNYTEDLIVGGSLFGYKIVLGGSLES